MAQITLNDTNYSGYSADITFSAYTGGSISLGTHNIPSTFSSDYYFGTYDLYYSQFNKTCQYNYPPALTMVANASIDLSFAFAIGGQNNFDLIIDWGDGSPLDYSYSGSSYYNTYHLYSNPLIYTITIQVSDPNTITDFYSSAPSAGIGYQNVIGVNEINLFPFLTNIYLDKNSIDTENLNSILISLSGVTQNFGNLLIDNQDPIACPTGDGLVALTYLQNDKYWYIQYNTGCP